MNIDFRSEFEASPACRDPQAALTAACLSAFVRRSEIDPGTCRALIEVLVADQSALTSFREAFEGPDDVPTDDADDPTIDGGLIDRIGREGLGAVPDASLPRLFADPDALLTLQVAVQMEAIRREEAGDDSPWYWGGRLRPDAIDRGSDDAPDGLVEILPDPLIRRRVDELCAEIRSDYAGRSPMIVPVLTGGSYFAMDLHRGLAALRPRCEPIVARSYVGTESGRIGVDLDMLDRIPFGGRDVLVVDDVLDTGQTLTEVTRLIRLRGPASVRTCVLLKKELRGRDGRPSRPFPMEPDYVGFPVGDAFVVGYGLDYEGAYRELRGIYELPPAARRPVGDQGPRILIRLVGRSGPTSTALSLSWLEARNLGPVAFEGVRLAFEFCARRGWDAGPEADGLHCEPVHEFREESWKPGGVLGAPVARRDLDDVLDRVRISFESRGSGGRRTTLTALSRREITQGRRAESEPGSYSFERTWRVPGPSADPLEVG